MELLRTTVSELLDDVCRRFPENEALVDLPKQVRYSYREFSQSIVRVAKGLLKIGIEKGDHVALWAPNGLEWIISEFAVARVGGVLVSIDANCRIPQLEYFLKQSDSKTLIMSQGLNGSEYVDMMLQLCPEIKTSEPGKLTSPNFPELKNVILMSESGFPGMFTWEQLPQIGKDVTDDVLVQRQRSCRTHDVVTMLYTSGTTGAPKGVMSTHFGILNTSAASAEIQRLIESDRLCLSVPLSHMFGCICVVLAAIIKGATIVIPSKTFHPRQILEGIERERCTCLYGSPGAMIALMEDPRYPTIHTRSLRTGIMGGAPCPMEVMRKVVEEIGAREIVIGYGQTEASSWITQTRPEDPLELRVSTVGRSLPNVDVKIIDPMTGEEVPKGVTGELCAKGFNMAGYYKMAVATEKALDKQGWLHTGDLAIMDEKGYVRMAGRLKEVIQKGGETIFPTDVEEVLYRIPGISNAQVFGVPDKQLGEEVAAWIKLEVGARLTKEDVSRQLQGRLSDFQMPRYVTFVEEFPMTPLGKVQKFKIREMAIREYGLG